MAKQPLTSELLNEAFLRLDSACQALGALTELLVQTEETATVSTCPLYELMRPSMVDLGEALNCLRDRTLS